MTFAGKARYKGPFDATGIPLLDYQGDIGRQHNPIAIAQYGLARFNRWSAIGQPRKIARHGLAWRIGWRASCARTATACAVWMHDFNWPYRQLLRAPWYSGLAQGNGVSLLVRAAKATGEAAYADAAHAAFESLLRPVSDGGVLVTDAGGDIWIEEYLVDPPSHILNGFIWALWGVYDYAQWSGSPRRRGCGPHASARFRGGSTSSIPDGGLSTRPATAAGKCWPAATTTRCTSRSCRSCTA